MLKIVFMGTPQAAVPSLGRLIGEGYPVVAVYTQPDRPAGRGNKIHTSPVKDFAVAHGLPVFQPLKIKTPEALKTFQSHAADVAVVVAYGRILPESFVTAFPKGAINVHFSLLPKYRGAAPVNWAIVNGETTTGVTTMQMDAGLDTGDILLQSETSIRTDETSVELMSRLSVIGADILSETLTRLDSLPRRSQDDSSASFAPIMQRSNGIIDWSMKASEIADRVRGFQPFPTAFTNFRGSRLTIWRAAEIAAFDDSLGGNASVNERANRESARSLTLPSPPVAGTILVADHDDLRIQCGSSVLKVDELQLEGKKRLSARDFLNGTHMAVGEVLG